MTNYLFEDSEWTFDKLRRTYDEIEKIGVGEMGFSIYPNQFEIISAEQMLDRYSSVGMPIYYHHWSFGKRFAREWENYKSGASGLAYELVINSSPCINYLMEDNTMTTQALVMAHAGIGHNFFFKNNYLFKEWTDAESIVDYLIFAKDYITETENKVGREEVEVFLDSCHALMDYGINRYKRPSKLSLEKEVKKQKDREDYLQSQVDDMYRILPEKKKAEKTETKFPKEPEENILYFCEKYSPNLKSWQRELIRIVRKISQYFYPQMLTKISNEGMASYCHYTIMNRLHEKGLITDGSNLEFLALHANVLYQPEWNDKRYSGMNPYKLGFEILRDVERICKNPTDEDRAWSPDLIGQNHLEVIKDIAMNYRDESLIRQYLSPKLIRDFKLFLVNDNKQDTKNYSVKAIQNEQGYQLIRDKMADQYEREVYVPKIEVSKADKEERTLWLEYTSINGRELHAPEKMLKHVRRLWGYPVLLHDTTGRIIAKG